jgi:hypothetical protein
MLTTDLGKLNISTHRINTMNPLGKILKNKVSRLASISPLKNLYRNLARKSYSFYLMLALLAIVSMSWVLVGSAGNHAVVAATPPKPIILAQATNCPNPDGDDDGDGLLNSWETLGYDADGNGTIDVNLPAMGADPKKKDIFVEIDWMEGCKGSITSFKPPVDALNQVVVAFQDAPVSGPSSDIKTGINLHLDYGQGGQFTGGQAIPCTPQITTELFTSLKNQYLDSNRSKIFHYNIWANEYNSESTTRGIAEFVGNDFILAFGSKDNSPLFRNQKIVLSTFMHELGHNLGLLHGGIASNQDSKPFKPNHLSVMNYLFSEGIIISKIDGKLDFTNALTGAIPPLDESALSEKDGLNSSKDLADYGTKWFCRQFNDTDKPAGIEPSIKKSIDWNCDKKISKQTLAANIDGSTELSPYKLLGSPGNEWENLILKDPSGTGIPSGGMNGGFILSPQRVISSNIESPVKEGDVIIERFPRWHLEDSKNTKIRQAEDNRLYAPRNFVAKLQGREVYLSWKSPLVNPVFNTYTEQYDPVEYLIYRLEEGRHSREEISLTQTKDLYFWDRTAIPGKSYFYAVVSFTNGLDGEDALSSRWTRIDFPQPIRIPPLPFSFHDKPQPVLPAATPADVNCLPQPPIVYNEIGTICHGV